MMNALSVRRTALRTLLAALVLLIAGLTRLGAQEVPDRPILRINPEMHSTKISRIDADGSGRLAITASNDKTARLWDTETGELIRRIRIPIGEGNEGRMYSAALSPDGRVAAVGGWTRYGGDRHTVFLVDVESGRILDRADVFRNVIFDLEYSPNGRYIAAGVGGSSDNVILDADTLEIVVTLDGYGASTNNVAWSSDGRLAVVSYDGAVRLYNRRFELTARETPSGGDRPFDLAFSPDDRYLAVGFVDTNRIQVLDGRTLGLRYEPDLTDVETGSDMAKPAWSRDGSLLYAAGQVDRRFDGEWMKYVRIWEDGGRGRYTDIGVADDTIMDLEVLADGRLLVAGAEPEVLLMERTGNVVWHNAGPNQGYAARDRSHFRISADARRIGADPIPGDPFTLPVDERQLLEEASSDPAAVPEHGGMSFSGWRDSAAPRLNGSPLDILDDYERNRSVDIARAGRYAILGSNWHIRRVDRDGELDWEIDAPGTVWTVNLADNERAFAAALNDGTIRWYKPEDGELLLSFYLHADRERWVMWTPAGYYDASPGGEQLIGWHMNRGLDEAPDFYPAATFRNRFYRPDIVRQVLNTFDEAEAIAIANDQRNLGPAEAVGEALPPVVRIVSPRRNAEVTSDEIEVELSVSAPAGAPVTDLRVLVNGRPAPSQRGLARQTSGDVRRIPVDLSGISGEEAVITVLAANRHGFSPPADVSVKLRGREFREYASAPKLYVLSIGVSDYRDNDLDLSYAAKDARDIADYFESQTGELYREVETRILTDRNATQESIEDGLFWLEEQVTANDIATIFVAGHGINDNRGELHFAPYDVDVNRLRRTGVPATDIVDTISYVQGRVVYFMDACHSGNLEVVRRSANGVDLNGLIQDLSAAENGAVVFSSAAGSQYALESPEWGNGAFTRALLEAFRGNGDYNNDGAVSINELNLYVGEEVKRLTNNQQTPVLQKPDSIRDFPIGVVR